MKPYPLVRLNHLTMPVGIVVFLADSRFGTHSSLITNISNDTVLPRARGSALMALRTRSPADQSGGSPARRGHGPLLGRPQPVIHWTVRPRATIGVELLPRKIVIHNVLCILL